MARRERNFAPKQAQNRRFECGEGVVAPNAWSGVANKPGGKICGAYGK